MNMLFSSQAEQDLIDLVCGRGGTWVVAEPGRLQRVIRAAREHGVEGFLPEMRDGARDLALRMQHQARTNEVAAIGATFAKERIDCVLLKGLAVAERFYERPWLRGSTDIDLLVSPADLAAALSAIERIGYTVDSGARTRGARPHQFHVECTSRVGTLAELHFAAYRGFGSEITAADLMTGSTPMPGFLGLSVPASAQELVYLAVHAAAHRFTRLGWLVDLFVVLQHAEPALLSQAREFARRVRFAEAFELSLSLLRSRFHLDLPAQPHNRVRFAEAIAREPERPVLRSATRFLYTALLCDGLREQAAYVTQAVLERATFASH